MLRRAILVVLATAVAGCGSSSPSAPTTTTNSTAAILVTAGHIVPAHLGDQLVMAGTLQNTGATCAAHIAGTMTVIDTAAGNQQYKLSWSVSPFATVAPGATLGYTACCLPLSANGHTLQASVTFTFDSIACPPKI